MRKGRRYPLKFRRPGKEISRVMNLEDIVDVPGPYCMSFAFELRPLIKSIEKVGLINNPIVAGNENETVHVVSGYRRLLAMKSLKWKNAPCVDLTDSGATPLDLFLLNLYDNLATREFNDVEKGMILNRLTDHVNRDEIIKHYMPLLDLPCHESTLETLIGVEELDEPVRNSFAKKSLSFRTIKALLEMEAESRFMVSTWALNIKFNFNQQDKFIEYIKDISIREDTTIYRILAEEPLLNIMKNKKLNTPQRAKLALELLKKRRFPLLTRYEKRFQEKVSDLALPKGVRIHHVPFFEAPDYRLEIVFRTGKELREKINELSRLDELENIVVSREEDS